MSGQLENLREQIDQIDRQLLELLRQRFAVTDQVGAYKAASGKAVFDPEREAAVIQDRLHRLQDDDLAPAVKSIYTLLMANSRQRQRRLCRNRLETFLQELPVTDSVCADVTIPVAYGGVEGSFGEEALLTFFGEGQARQGYPYFSQVIDAVRTGQAQYGVLPLENSSTGAVIQVYDLLREGGCFLVGEVKLPIRHCLLGLPGAKLAGLHKIYSHPQGLSQSSRFLQAHPSWEGVPYLNTAMSARLVRDSGDLTMAAIGSRRCAQEYGLEILAENIQDSEHNHTRFVVIGSKALRSEKANKISLCFDLAHSSGSLYQILTFFAIHQINLLKLESRPIPEKNWEYSFFMDLEGNLYDRAVQDASCSVMDETVRFRYLGNYPG